MYNLLQLRFNIRQGATDDEMNDKDWIIFPNNLNPNIYFLHKRWRKSTLLCVYIYSCVCVYWECTEIATTRGSAPKERELRKKR